MTTNWWLDSLGIRETSLRGLNTRNERSIRKSTTSTLDSAKSVIDLSFFYWIIFKSFYFFPHKLSLFYFLLHYFFGKERDIYFLKGFLNIYLLCWASLLNDLAFHSKINFSNFRNSFFSLKNKFSFV